MKKEGGFLRESLLLLWVRNMSEIQFTYGPATPEKLEQIWDQNIAANPGDNRWVRWKKQLMDDNAAGKCLTFLVLADDRPIGEGTLLFDEDCGAIIGRRELAECGKTTNINGLRIEKAFEGQGHISRLVREMEAYARRLGYTEITIGVEAAEARNLAIYLHWGYTRFLLSEVDEGELVLYYGKCL